MGKKRGAPRYNVVALRLSDAKLAIVKGLRGKHNPAVKTSAFLRVLLMSAANLLASSPASPAAGGLSSSYVVSADNDDSGDRSPCVRVSPHPSSAQSTSTRSAEVR